MIHHDDTVATLETPVVHCNRNGRITVTVGHAQLDWPDDVAFYTWTAGICQQVAAQLKAVTK